MLTLAQMALTDEQKSKVVELAKKNIGIGAISKTVGVKPYLVRKHIEVIRKTDPEVDKIRMERAARFLIPRPKQKVTLQNIKKEEVSKMSVNIDEVIEKLRKTLGDQVSQSVLNGLTKYDELKSSQVKETERLTALEEVQRRFGGLEQTITDMRSRQETQQKQMDELAAKSFPPDICEKVPELCKLAPDLQEIVKKAKEGLPHKTAEEWLNCPTCGPAFKEEVKKDLEEWCKTDPKMCEKIVEIVKAHPEAFAGLEVKKPAEERKGFL